MELHEPARRAARDHVADEQRTARREQRVEAPAQRHGGRLLQVVEEAARVDRVERAVAAEYLGAPQEVLDRVVQVDEPHLVFPARAHQALEPPVRERERALVLIEEHDFDPRAAACAARRAARTPPAPVRPRSTGCGSGPSRRRCRSRSRAAPSACPCAFARRPLRASRRRRGSRPSRTTWSPRSGRRRGRSSSRNRRGNRAACGARGASRATASRGRAGSASRTPGATARSARGASRYAASISFESWTTSFTNSERTRSIRASRAGESWSPCATCQGREDSSSPNLLCASSSARRASATSDLKRSCPATRQFASFRPKPDDSPPPDHAFTSRRWSTSSMFISVSKSDTPVITRAPSRRTEDTRA